MYSGGKSIKIILAFDDNNIKLLTTSLYNLIIMLSIKRLYAIHKKITLRCLTTIRSYFSDHE